LIAVGAGAKRKAKADQKKAKRAVKEPGSPFNKLKL
jgi:hypothetical protein